MSSQAVTDAERQQWQAIKVKVFSAEGLTIEQKAAAWKQLTEQDLQKVQLRLDVDSEELPAVLRNEIPGAARGAIGAAAANPPAGSKIWIWEYAGRVAFFIFVPIIVFAIGCAAAWDWKHPKQRQYSEAAYRTVKALMDASDVVFKVLLWKKLGEATAYWLHKQREAATAGVVDAV